MLTTHTIRVLKRQVNYSLVRVCPEAYTPRIKKWVGSIDKKQYEKAIKKLQEGSILIINFCPIIILD